MTPQTASPFSQPRPAEACHPPRRPRRSPALLAAATFATAVLLAAACAGGGTGSAGGENGIAIAAPSEAAERNAAALASRPGEGIRAAGGTMRGGAPCPAPGSPGAPDTFKLGVLSPDVDQLGDIGLANLVFDPVDRTFNAYVNQVNEFGGIGGNCFEFVYYEWGFTNPAEDIGAICAALPQDQPLVLFGFALSPELIGCSTLAGQIPTIGLYSAFPADLFTQASGLLFADHGSLEFLLYNGVLAAEAAGTLNGAVVGLVHSGDDSAASIRTTMALASEETGIEPVAAVGVPEGLYGTAVVVVEEQFRAIGGELFHPDEAAFAQAAAQLPPGLGELMAAVRGFSIATAAAMAAAGVTAVVTSADWVATRNLMRAAEFVGWRPAWIANDTQLALITLTDAPAAQGLNLVQASSRRATDDPIDGLDRGCLSLRNTSVAAEPFDHRYHTDAWSLLTSTCDYLDVVFSAVSRVDGPLNRDAFLAALAETDYTTAHGQRLQFAANDTYGSDSFRLLSADPDCVLNEWGCMRPLTGWYDSATARLMPLPRCDWCMSPMADWYAASAPAGAASGTEEPSEG
ncbi:MAG: hypothetical protein OXH20_09885 [bacterium]|nr:hypothetical protein [bacterium]MDE0669947.1 hypothetical protein [bacterium]